MEAIADKLQLPFHVVAALDKDRYRKPCLGGWEYFVECENGGVEVDKGSSVYVGDAAGREANWRRGRCLYTASGCYGFHVLLVDAVSFRPSLVHRVRKI